VALPGGAAAGDRLELDSSSRLRRERACVDVVRAPSGERREGQTLCLVVTRLASTRSSSLSSGGRPMVRDPLEAFFSPWTMPAHPGDHALSRSYSLDARASPTFAATLLRERRRRGKPCRVWPKAHIELELLIERPCPLGVFGTSSGLAQTAGSSRRLGRTTSRACAHVAVSIPAFTDSAPSLAIRVPRVDPPFAAALVCRK